MVQTYRLLDSMLKCEWNKARYGAPEDSFMETLIQLALMCTVEDLILRMELANMVKQEKAKALSEGN